MSPSRAAMEMLAAPGTVVEEKKKKMCHKLVLMESREARWPNRTSFIHLEYTGTSFLHRNADHKFNSTQVRIQLMDFQGYTS